jgi:hypothetical protein
MLIVTLIIRSQLRLEYACTLLPIITNLILIPVHMNFANCFQREKGNTRYEQARTVFVRVIGALSDNPVISQVGWDVVLSVLSLCVWAVQHNVDVHFPLSRSSE